MNEGLELGDFNGVVATRGNGGGDCFSDFLEIGDSFYYILINFILAIFIRDLKGHISRKSWRRLSTQREDVCTNSKARWLSLLRRRLGSAFLLERMPVAVFENLDYSHEGC